MIKDSIRRFAAILLFLALYAFTPQAIKAENLGIQNGAPPNVQLTIISERTSVKSGSSFHIAIVQNIAPGWHTYWRNPGDVGAPMTIDWTLPKGVKIGEIKWPRPNAIPYEGFVNYGYSDKAIFPLEVQLDSNIIGPIAIKGKVQWLECKEICIPGSSEISLTLNLGDNELASNEAADIEAALANLPTVLSANTIIENSGENFILGVESAILMQPISAQFFPYEVADGALIDHVAPQILEFGDKGLSLKLKKSPSLPESLKAPIGGVLVVKNSIGEKAYVINAQIGKLMAGVAGQKPRAPIEFQAILRAMVFAFIGGLILNLMPCVFPILAMKIFGLTKIAHDGKQNARTYGLLYGLGVIVTFAILGAILFVLKSIGEGIGWGFQLQNPIFLMAIILLITAIAFNLLGLFEFGTNLQGIGQSAANQAGNWGAFASGALAVAVASPCTAPFMGAALGFAVLQQPIIGLLIFLCLGIGFALPFTLLTFAPKLLRFLPKPGAWMVWFRQLLALPMLLTAAWLLWVLYRSGGIVALSAALVSALFLLLVLVLKKDNPANKGLSFAWPAFGLILAIGFYQANIAQKSPQISTRIENGLLVETWSPEKVAALQLDGRIIFVNFTADWCITCKVNENSAFKNSRVINAFKEKNVAYLVADWTKRDEIIASALSSHGRIGVPMYLVYLPDAKEPVVLPQLLNAQTVITALSGE